MAQVTCKNCKTKINKEDAINPKERTYFCSTECEKAWDDKHVVVKKDNSEKDDYKELIAYLCELYGVKSPSIVWLTQIKRFHDNRKMKYKGMQLALKYYYETLGNALNEEYGLGILEWVYDDAKNYFLEKRRILKAINEFDEEEVVKVVKPNIKSIERLKHQNDISEL